MVNYITNYFKVKISSKTTKSLSRIPTVHLAIDVPMWWEGEVGRGESQVNKFEKIHVVEGSKGTNVG